MNMGVQRPATRSDNSYKFGVISIEILSNGYNWRKSTGQDSKCKIEKVQKRYKIEKGHKGLKIKRPRRREGDKQRRLRRSW